MKKIITMSAALLVGFAVNAASCTWGNMAGEWYDVDGNDLTGGDATIFFYLGNVTASDSAFDTSAATYVTRGGFDWDNWGYGAVGEPVDLAGVATTTAGQAYTLVLVDQDVSSLDGYNGNYILMTGSSEEVSVPGATTTYYGDFTNGSAVNASSWSTMGGTPVPEPTSGLLMLLGVAGLALKRKRM